MKRMSFVVLLAWLCSGCIHSYGLKSIERSGSLRMHSRALVVLPEDVQHGETRYAGSGREVALAVKQAFATRMDSSDLTLRTGEWKKHLKPAQELGFDYLVVPTVLAWEDQALKGMGHSQRAEVELQIIETDSGKTLAVGRVKGKRKWDTNSKNGAQELLELPLRSYINWLLSPPDTPLPQPRVEPAQSGRK